MAWLVGLVALTVPALGARVALHEHEGSSAGHLSAEDSAKASRGFKVLSMLKVNPEDVELQNEYRDIIGDVDWEESKVFLQTGAKIEQTPVLLGQMSTTGTVLKLAELLTDAQTNERLPVAIGRLTVNRRDYVVEEEGGESKYLIDGVTFSLHSRMHVSIAGEVNPKFILRRAFNYLNPVAQAVGQTVMRVVECDETPLGDGTCNEGEILYTITKDRFGRGLMWGQDEYRVYTGTGGCTRMGHGVLSCLQSDQIMYSLSAGLSEGTHDTDYYQGNIVEIDGDGQSGTISMGVDNGEVQVGARELEGMKVARVTKVAGPPRWLHWPILATAGSGAMVGAYPLTQVLGAGYNLARALVWADAYEMRFEGAGGAVDDLLLSLMAAAQDLNRDRTPFFQLEGGVVAAGVTINVNAVAAGAGAVSGAAAAAR